MQNEHNWFVDDPYPQFPSFVSPSTQVSELFEAKVWKMDSKCSYVSECEAGICLSNAVTHSPVGALYEILGDIRIPQTTSKIRSRTDCVCTTRLQSAFHSLGVSDRIREMMDIACATHTLGCRRSSVRPLTWRYKNPDRSSWVPSQHSIGLTRSSPNDQLPDPVETTIIPTTTPVATYYTNQSN